MNPKAAPLEARKKRSQAKLDARRVLLKEKGLTEDAIGKDVGIRKLKAELRKSDFRLASIVAQEEITRQVAKAKAEKLAAAKAPGKEPPGEIPAKKEKKPKKERSEKKVDAESKKEKTENKAAQSPEQ